jgi:hypothetical protein
MALRLWDKKAKKLIELNTYGVHQVVKGVVERVLSFVMV